LEKRGIEGISVDSAGLLALPGRAATPLALQAASEFGVDLSEHQAKPVSESLLAWSDLVLVMEKSHQEALSSAFSQTAESILLLRHFARHGSRRRGISDPYGLQYEAYRFSFLDIEEAVTGLADYLAGAQVAFEPIRVRCYEGYKGSESPRSFTWAGRTHDIAKILDRWYDNGPDPRSEVTDYFKVQTGEGSVYIIKHSRIFDSWAIRTDTKAT
jgi:protein-tyrosine-phosphatase